MAVVSHIYTPNLKAMKNLQCFDFGLVQKEGMMLSLDIVLWSHICDRMSICICLFYLQGVCVFLPPFIQMAM